MMLFFDRLMAWSLLLSLVLRYGSPVERTCVMLHLARLVAFTARFA